VLLRADAIGGDKVAMSRQRKWIARPQHSG
jgi:hypothetical protein